MTFSLGLDTGGTYTDAVVFDDVAGRVIAKAKAPTTRHDLAIGISAAARTALNNIDVHPHAIGLVSISTTLATNALVEGQGGRVCLVMIGFDERDMDKAGLRAAHRDDPVVFLPGGHTVHGKPHPLDMSVLDGQLDALSGQVSAFAVVGLFAVRNAEHEIAVRDLIASRCDLPVTCSHELTAKLDGPKRALTTVLNARLIEMITRLIAATRSFLISAEIDAPLMVVRGDGSLVSADFAAARPIETILSGPAASLVGAAFLTGEDNALVSDIGGTTTDIALLEDGRPKTDPNGAVVGGYQTMVDAVAMRTFGLAGDSEVSIDEGALVPTMLLGPRRLVPLSMLATSHETIVMEALAKQANAAFVNRLDGRFAMATGVNADVAHLSKSETDLLSRLGNAPQALASALKSTSELATLNMLVARGLAFIAGFTPSDAQHVLGHFSHWHAGAAEAGAALFAQKKDGYGKPIAPDGASLAQWVVSRLVRLSAERVLETAYCDDGLDGPALVRSPIVTRALDRTDGLVRHALIIDRPLIGLGAAAHAYYPAIAETLSIGSSVPEHADVANAVGAVVGQVRMTVTLSIERTEDGLFMLTGGDLPEGSKTRFAQEEASLSGAEALARQAVSEKALLAGARECAVDVVRDVQSAMVEGQNQFISATVTAMATGRPSLVAAHTADGK